MRTMRNAVTLRPVRAALAMLALAGVMCAQGPRAIADPLDEPLTPNETAKAIVGAFDKLFGGPHAGQRPVHAKGILVEGTFEPSEAAGILSRAEHFQARVPVLVRFSDFAGVPSIPDGDANASPRGMAIKFSLPDGNETDIVAHAYNGFPAATADEFLGFLQAVAAPDPAVLKQFAATHPAARTFLDTPKPAPASYATERFFGVNAFRFTNAAGVSRFGRYRIEPVAGPKHLSAAEAAQRAPDFLSEELAQRLKRGPVEFRLTVQIAKPDDAVADGSKPWPEDRPIVDAGVIRLTGMVPNGDTAQRELLFTPLALVGGIAPSADPLLIARTRAYRVSFERRQGSPAGRAASSTTGSK